MAKIEVVVLFVVALFIGSSTAQNCGSQAGNALCQNGLCCSKFGWCGSTPDHCGEGCQSQCSGSNPTPTPTTPSGGGNGVGSIITETLFNEMLKYSKDPRCPSNGFYSYSAFITAASSFSEFGTTGDLDTRKRELAAFFGQTSHETTGGWDEAPDGPYAWGYCFVREGNNPPAYCSSTEWPCPAGKMYYGRGPIQLTHNNNYGLAGQALKLDLINDPDQVATNAVTSFKTAMWFWMTPQGNKPSSHKVIIGQWTPSETDRAAGRVPGYGVITNIINGGLECGNRQDSTVVSKVLDRIGFYKRYCDMLGVSPGDNLDCFDQQHF